MVSTAKGKFLSDPKYAFTFEAYANGMPAPNILRKEVDIAQPAPLLFRNPEFSRTEVVKACAHTIVAAAIDYWKHTIELKKEAQVERVKRVRIFNPLHVFGNNIPVCDTEALRILKLPQHPQIILQIEVMKPKSKRCTRLLLTPSSHWWKERMGRGRALLTCRIGERQTVQNYQQSPTCCVQCSLTHPTLAHMSVALASSTKLSMTIRSRLTPTTCSH